jgi:hypothetical protein
MGTITRIDERAHRAHGQNLEVRLGVEVRFAGDYFVEVSMPKVGSAVALAPFDFIECDLSLVIAKAGTKVHSQHIETMNRATESGWGLVRAWLRGATLASPRLR